ncbi:sigma-70 family RNA polymerase sigma factor [Aureimonas leprariae]|uniref:RNA polymerase sigma factor n=1 Tax=Plantimonas leprariae TaxID=2615207 RepID=A0A7V7TYS8_9HYPH|nr:sigma-70 family RNA polymerase sigma factor [Aureimonas leprariae]KAB0677775.1 sigma-70 family RNA polymerase sigma factor [Aureimonas leprariae]
MTPDQGRQYLVDRLHAVAGGDRAALQDVYRRTSAKLFGTILRILPDREEAEDVLQETYLAVWNKADRFDATRASPVTWLATIARNRAIDRLRAIAPRGRSHGPLEAAAEIEDGAPGALAALEAGDEARRLAGCLETLEERARGAVVAAFYGGRTYEDLANSGGVPLGTMKSLIRRALIRLKGCLEA